MGLDTWPSAPPAMSERTTALWPNEGEADPPEQEAAYQSLPPVTPRDPALPETAPAALVWLVLPG